MSCKACAETPVAPSNLEPLGNYKTIAGYKTYLTGSTTATKALICVYDIFGLHDHTLHGADRLVDLMGSDTLVLVPDLFKGEPCALDWVPSDTAEKKQLLQSFMEHKANADSGVSALLEVTKAAQADFQSVKSWGLYGLCWGGKLAALVSGADSLFQASGTAHPGRLDVSDARAMTIPHVCLFSKQDGDEKTVTDYTTELQKKSVNYVEKYGTMHHGWMGARANLADQANVAEYERGYKKFAEFFTKRLR